MKNSGKRVQSMNLGIFYHHALTKSQNSQIPGLTPSPRKVKDIAQHFNRKPMTIILEVKKVEELFQRDRDFSRRVIAIA